MIKWKNALDCDTTERTYIKNIQFKILHKEIKDSDLIKENGKSESKSCLYCKEIDTQAHAMGEKRYLTSLQNVRPG